MGWLERCGHVEPDKQYPREITQSNQGTHGQRESVQRASGTRPEPEKGRGQAEDPQRRQKSVQEVNGAQIIFQIFAEAVPASHQNIDTLAHLRSQEDLANDQN